jgi:hypothetical protein
MLSRYKPGDRVSDEDAVDLTGHIARHREAVEKIGVGIDRFEVQNADYGTQCFRGVRTDDTWERFSFNACLAPGRARA